ncbi:MAG TPA: AzlD domain-containing protein [Candidatus Nanopelagicales bacterium]
MSMWGVVAVVGAVSLAVRALPLVRTDAGWLGPRAEQALRHAGIGAMAALLVGALLPGPAGLAGPQLGLLVAVAVGGVLAWRGRSMIVVVAAGVVVSVAVTTAAALC